MEQLIEKITKALQELVTLRIVTIVGNIAYTDKGDMPVTNPKVISTDIDLLQGDIVTKFDEVFVTGPLQAIREFHAEREKQGAAIVKTNIEALEKLFEFALKLRSSQPPAPPAPPKP